MFFICYSIGVEFVRILAPDLLVSVNPVKWNCDECATWNCKVFCDEIKKQKQFNQDSAQNKKTSSNSLKSTSPVVNLAMNGAKLRRREDSFITLSR